jgi:hypothetical protein
MLRDLAEMVQPVMDGKLTTKVVTFPIKDVEESWTRLDGTKDRVVALF